ncbi:MAG: HAD-IIB family hydrolase [Solobacterium sp.]|nr:HAD-IIB family hydrolase [Solobacterium sp.]
MKKKALFLDIDNTLFSSRSGIVPESAVDAIKEARKNGNYVFLCTGRSRAESMKYLNYPVDGFVFASGASCFAFGKNIYDHPIAEEKVNEIRKMIEEMQFGVLLGGAKKACLDEQCYRGLDSYLNRSEKDPEVRKRTMEANGMFPMSERIKDDPVYKLGASKPHEASFEPLIRLLPSPFRLVQTLSSEAADFGDISDATNRKSDGIARILSHIGIPKEDAVGIGDSGNDTDMLAYCGLGIAMGNGSEEVKAIADWVTSDIDDDGIRNAFAYAGVI